MLLSEMGSFKFCYTCIHTYIDILKHTYRDKTDIHMRACMYACVHTYTQTNAHIRTSYIQAREFPTHSENSCSALLVGIKKERGAASWEL